MGKVLLENLDYTQDEELRHGSLLISEDTIEMTGDISAGGIKTIDCTGLTALPGFIDMHTHGGNGVDINHASENDMDILSSFYARCGVTGFLASVLSDSGETTEKNLACLKKSMTNTSKGARLLGIHLEGPFLAKGYKGAMPEKYLKFPDMQLFAKYCETSGDNIRMITISPELEGACEFTKEVSNMGIAVSIGHSGATYEEAMRCIDAGAKSATHVMNAMSPLHQHNPGILGAVLESDIYCETICDGRHLHPAIVRLLLKTKGIKRIVAVTDSIMAAGLSDGKYMLGVNDIYVKNGDALLENGVRAGSTLTGIQALKNLVCFTGKSVCKLVPLLTENPAALLGMQNRKGKLLKGYDADITIVDKELNVKMVFVSGQKIKITGG